MPEGELFPVLLKVVRDVDDQTSVGPAVLWTAQPPPDHLLVEQGATDGPGDEECPSLRYIESCREDEVETGIGFCVPVQINAGHGVSATQHTKQYATPNTTPPRPLPAYVPGDRRTAGWE